MNIIITGTGRGIGFELVKQLSAAGHTILAVSRDTSITKKFTAPSVITLVADISTSEGISKVEETIKERMPVVNGLVNNAGSLLNKAFETIQAKEMEFIYNVNVFTPARLIQVVMPFFADDIRSHVVNISSMGGFQGSAKFAGLSMYSSSKAALACLTECLAEEYKDRNIAFNCLALGAAQTEMLNEAFPGYKAPLSATQMAEFIAGFIVTGHNFMNGRIIPVSMSTP